MTAYVFKRSGARTYSGRYRLAGDKKINQVSLDCTNRQVAEKRLREIVEEKSGSAQELSRRRPSERPRRRRLKSIWKR
jgi:hypothetical protein